ncbi:MAG: hypothetical protein WD468_09365 [Pirellulales bacterium]
MPNDLNDSCAPVAEVTAAELERARRDRLCQSEHSDAIAYEWSRIGLGTIAAGVVYPIVLGMILFVVAIASSLWNGITIFEAERLAIAAITIATYSILFGSVGLLWSMVVSTITLPVIYFFARSLDLRASIISLGAFSGGLVGFICTLPLSLQLPWHTFPSDHWQFVVFLLGGPCLATVLGQIGGAWGGSKSRAAGPKKLAWSNAFDPVADAPPITSTLRPNESFESTKLHFQFGIRHMLWVSVWLSLLLALIRVCRIPFELILPLLSGWLVFQAASIWVGERLIRRIAAWRERPAAGKIIQGRISLCRTKLI